MWENLHCVSLFTEYGTILSSFQRISTAPPRVSFGWSVLVKDLYQRALDAGKWKQKYNSGPKPRSGSGGKRLDSSTGGPPLCSTQEYCSPAPAGGLPTGSNCRSQSEFPKDTTKECWGGQTGGRDPVDAFEYFYVALSGYCVRNVGVLLRTADQSWVGEGSSDANWSLILTRVFSWHISAHVRWCCPVFGSNLSFHFSRAFYAQLFFLVYRCV